MHLRISFPVCVVITILISTHSCAAKDPGYIKDLTISKDEKQSMEELRERLKNNPDIAPKWAKDDLVLIRILRTEFFDVSKAEQLFLRHLQWEKDVDLNRIEKDDWSDMKRKFKFSLKGRDREGRPLLFISAGSWNFREILITGKVEKLERYCIYAINEGYKLIRELGRKQGNVTQEQIIINVKGINPVQQMCPRCIPLLLKLFTYYNDHQIGWADKVYVINTPVFVEPVIRMSKAILHPITKQSIRIYGTNRNLWWKELMKDFTPDQLPEELGGTLKAYEDDEEDIYDF